MSEAKSIIKCSVKLNSYIESKFQEFIPDSESLREQRLELRKQKDLKRKKEQRERQKDLKALWLLKREKIISDEVYQDGRERVLKRSSYKRDEKRQSEIDSKDILKGKAHDDFNIFVETCYRLVKAENRGNSEVQDIQIFRLITEFLDSKEYRKRNDKAYSENDIKRIVYLYDTDLTSI